MLQVGRRLLWNNTRRNGIPEPEGKILVTRAGGARPTPFQRVADGDIIITENNTKVATFIGFSPLFRTCECLDRHCIFRDVPRNQRATHSCDSLAS